MSSSARWTLIVVLLAPAVVLPLLVPLYDTEDPTLFGFPFYFWFQLALIPVAVVLTVIAYYLAKGADRVTARPRRGGAAMSDVSTVAFSVFLFFFLLVTVLGFAAARWRRAAGTGQPRRVGPRRPRLRHVHRLVPDRRRPLHGLHVRRGARAAVRRQRDRLLRGAVHDRGLPADLPVPAAAVVGLATGTATSRRPTSCRAATTAGRSRWRSRSPASSRRCPTSRCSWSASRSSSR